MSPEWQIKTDKCTIYMHYTYIIYICTIYINVLYIYTSYIYIYMINRDIKCFINDNYWDTQVHLFMFEIIHNKNLTCINIT